MAAVGSLAPYRILDLTTERGWLAGKLLADLGAQVTKVEPPGGDPGRLRPPFAEDRPDPDGGLRWRAFNRGKRSVTLDLATPLGRDRLLALAAEADAVLESFDPGQMEACGIGPAILHAANPRIVLTRISPFGQTGPYAHFAASDLILAAIGGAAWLAGDEDRAPVRVTAPQYFLHASAEAALHTVVALWHAATTGKGQAIDMSAQAATVRTLMNGFTHAYTGGRLLRREGLGKPGALFPTRILFRCADGHLLVAPNFGAGLAGYRAWAREEGETIPDFFAALTDEELARGRDLITPGREWLAGKITTFLEDFYARRTGKELVRGGMQRRLLISVINTLSDILDDEQLIARDHYRSVRHADDTVAAYPSVWAHLGATPLADTAAAPTPGEHDGATWDDAGGARCAGGAVRDGSPDVLGTIKVWDASWAAVGPLTARYLGDYGAKVVHTESARSVDVLRGFEPFKDGVRGINRSQFFAEYNPSKLGLGVNFATPEGRSIGLRLAAWADVVIESFSPGVMERLDLSYETLSKANPSLIMLSTSMNGQTGPRRRFFGFGTQLAAMAGMVDLTGWPDRLPSTPFGAYTDFIAQRFCGLALIAALDHRRRTGEGQYIDLSQYEASLQFLAPYLLDAGINRRAMSRDGNRSPDGAPHGIFRCLDEDGQDRWVAIAVESDTQWTAFVRRIGAPAWTAEARFADLAGRKANEDALEARVAEWTAGRTARAVFDLLQPEVPAAPVLTNLELVDDPQLRHRGYLRELRHEEVGDIFYEGSQALLSETPYYPRKAAPAFGADSLMVLRDLLDYAPDEIEELVAAGAVELQGPVL